MALELRAHVNGRVHTREALRIGHHHHGLLLHPRSCFFHHDGQCILVKVPIDVCGHLELCVALQQMAASDVDVDFGTMRTRLSEPFPLVEANDASRFQI